MIDNEIYNLQQQLALLKICNREGISGIVTIANDALLILPHLNDSLDKEYLIITLQVERYYQVQMVRNLLKEGKTTEACTEYEQLFNALDIALNKVHQLIWESKNQELTTSHLPIRGFTYRNVSVL